MTAREEILSRIRTALPGDPLDPAASHGSIPRLYNRTGTLTPEARLELFIDRLLDYDTEIVPIETAAEIPAAISQAAREERLVTPPDFPAEWLPTGLAIAFDNNLSTAEIDHAQAVLTTCEIAVASTGTIILVHTGAQGRRALTLLPDHHICIVRRDQVVETIPEAFTAIATQSALPITTISGPSATSDIEMTRIRGVHGPRRLTVILYGAASPSK
ncbi:MAG TPA: LUD domain-containing protein [Acidobacteriaceae bacterium]